MLQFCLYLYIYIYIYIYIGMNNKTKIVNSAIVKLAILIYYFSSDLFLAYLTICHNSA